VNVVVAGGTVSEIMLHYIEKYRMMVLKVTSKFELKRICKVCLITILCKALGATPIARLGSPIPDEIGTCDSVFVQEIGSQKVVIFEKNTDQCKLATIVLRGATNNLLDDVERAIEDGVNLYRSIVKDGRFVYGGGATEMVI
jgi:T-complex protein 1 subunit theta